MYLENGNGSHSIELPIQRFLINYNGVRCHLCAEIEPSSRRIHMYLVFWGTIDSKSYVADFNAGGPGQEELRYLAREILDNLARCFGQIEADYPGFKVELTLTL